MISKFYVEIENKGAIKIVVTWHLKKIMIYNRNNDLIFENKGEVNYEKRT